VEKVSYALRRIKTNESTIPLGDFNAHVRNDAGYGKVCVIGRHGDADVNDNGRLLLQLCCNNALYIMNTFFQHWSRNSLSQRSLTDFFIDSADLFRSMLDVRIKTGVKLSTDQHLLVCNLHLGMPPGSTQTCRTRRSYRLKWEALADKDVRKTFVSSLF